MNAPRVAKITALGLGIIGMLLFMTVIVLTQTSWGNERVRRIVVSQANDRLTGELAIGRLRGNLFSHAVIDSIALIDSSRAPVFTARRVDVRYSLVSALRGKVVIESAVLDTPFVLLDKKPGARWNFQSLMRPKVSKSDSKGAKPEIGEVTINHGRFLYRRPWKPDSTLSQRGLDSLIAKTLSPTARKRTERVAHGFQRVLDYHDIDAKLGSVRIGDSATPTAVSIAKLAMIAEPYRPPGIDIRSLVGVLYASKDSLWWRDARMVLPASNVSGDGTIGFRRSGFRLDLRGAPIAVADLRWLNPKLPARGGGAVRYAMHVHADTSEFSISDADLRYDSAHVAGRVSVARVSPDGGKKKTIVRDADLTIEQLSTALLKELAPSIKFRRTGTLSGRLVATSDTELDANVRFDDVIAGRSNITARGAIDLGSLAARDLTVTMRPLQIASIGDFVKNGNFRGVLSGNVVVNGSKASGWSGSGDLSHVDRGEESRVSGTGRYSPGSKRIVAELDLRPLSLVVAGRFVPKAELRGDVTGRINARGTTRDMRVSGVLRSREGGLVEVRGSGSIAGRSASYDLTARLDSVNARALSARAPETRLTGTVAVRGSGTRAATLNANVLADLVRSRYDTFAVDRVHVDARAANGVATVRRLDVSALGIEGTASGTFGLIASRSGELTFAVAVDSLQKMRRWLGSSDSALAQPSIRRQASLKAAARADSVRRAEAMRIEQLALGLPLGVTLHMDTLVGFRRDSLAGSLIVDGVARGNIKRAAVDATVKGNGLIARGSSVDSLRATISTANVLDRKLPLAFSAAAHNVQSSGFAFENIRTTGTWRDRVVTANLLARQDSLVSYAALGSYARSADKTHAIRLDSLSARFDSLLWRLARPGSVQFAKDLIVADSIDLRSSRGGRIFAHGSALPSGALRFDLEAEEVRISTILRALQRDSIGEGVVSIAGRATGTRALPELAGKAALRGALYGDVRAPDADADFNYRAKRLDVTATGRDTSARRVFSGTASLPYDLAFGSVEGSRKIPGALTADVMLDSLSLAALPFETRALEEFHGMLAGNLSVRGDWKKPVYTGRVALRDGGLTVPKSNTGMVVTRTMADVRITGDSAILDSLVGYAKGRFRATGAVDFTNRSRPTASFWAAGTDLRVFDSPRGVVDADAEVFGNGPLDELRVTGGGEMKGGFLALKSFRKDLLRVKAPGMLSFFAVYDTAATAGDKLRVSLERQKHRKLAVIADLDLIVHRGNYYRNKPDANTEFFTGEGEVIRAHLDQRTSDQWAIGFVRIGDGGVTFFRTRGFIPARGALTFGTHTKAPGIVQQVGERMVWDAGRGLFPVQLMTGGTSVGPAIGLESGSLFPIRGRELNGYLTMGRLGLSLLQQSGSSLSGSMEMSGQLSGETGALAHRQQAATAFGVVFHDIGTGASKEFTLDAFSISPADVPTEIVFGKTGGFRGSLVEGGRYITPDLYLAGQFRLTRGLPGFRVEKRFGTRYRIDMGIEPRHLFSNPEELGITHPTKRASAFGAFLTRRWAW